jgi:hypothetical protein
MPEEIQSIALPFGDKPVLEVEGVAASIELVPILAGESPRIEHLGIRRDSQVEVKQQDGVVKVHIGTPNRDEPEVFGWLAFLGRGVPQAFRLHVPASVTARVRSDMGIIRAEGLEACDLSLATSAGMIQLQKVSGRLVLRLDAGQIRGDHLRGTFDVETSAGEVRLGIDALEPGEHRMHSRMGAVRVELAPGLKVRIVARTAMGSTRNRYPSTADAEATLKLEAELGSVRVDETRGHQDARAGSWEDWHKHWAGDPRRWERHRARDWKRWVRDWTGEWPGPPGTSPDRPSPTPAPAGSAASSPISGDELKRILTLVQDGKINAEEAERLIRALEGR